MARLTWMKGKQNTREEIIQIANMESKRTLGGNNVMHNVASMADCKDGYFLAMCFVIIN